MKFKYSGLLGKTEEEQKENYLKLLKEPLKPNETPAGRMALLDALLGQMEDEEEE